MANKVKETADYFPFYVKDGRTLYVMQKKYGLSGVGFFTQVMRKLTQTPKHYYVYVEDFDKDRFNDFVGMSETDVRNYMADMVRTGKIDKELWEERGVIWCQDFVDGLDELYTRRKTEKPTKEIVKEETEQYVSNMSAICDQYEDNIPQYVQQRKGKETKGKETIYEPVGSDDETVAQPPAKPKGTQKDADAAAWESILTQIQPSSTWSNYGKERQSCKTLAQRSRSLLPDVPFDTMRELMQAVVQEYDRLKRQNRQAYWKQAPWTPSAVLHRWSQVWDSIAQRNAVGEEVPF